MKLDVLINATIMFWKNVTLLHLSVKNHGKELLYIYFIYTYVYIVFYYIACTV